MAFATNYEDINDYDLIPQGEYEVIIRNIEERTTRKGSTGLNLSLVIRNDVEQNYKNRYVFHNLWKKKEPTPADMQVQGYSFKQIMQLAKSAKLPSGKSYESVQDLCKDLQYRALRVKIIHDTYNGNTSEKIDRINESKFPQCQHVWKQAAASSKPDTFAQRPETGFAGQSQQAIAATIGDLSDFEEILSNDEVPF